MPHLFPVNRPPEARRLPVRFIGRSGADGKEQA